MYICHLTAGVIRYGISAITDGCPHDDDIDDDNDDRCVTVVCGVFFVSVLLYICVSGVSICRSIGVWGEWGVKQMKKTTPVSDEKDNPCRFDPKLPRHPLLQG